MEFKNAVDKSKETLGKGVDVAKRNLNTFVENVRDDLRSSGSVTTDLKEAMDSGVNTFTSSLKACKALVANGDVRTAYDQATDSLRNMRRSPLKIATGGLTGLKKIVNKPIALGKGVLGSPLWALRKVKGGVNELASIGERFSKWDNPQGPKDSQGRSHEGQHSTNIGGVNEGQGDVPPQAPEGPQSPPIEFNEAADKAGVEMPQQKPKSATEKLFPQVAKDNKSQSSEM